MAENESVRRSNVIIVMDKTKRKGIILDPLVTFKISHAQPKYRNEEKIKIYNRTIEYLL